LGPETRIVFFWLKNQFIDINIPILNNKYYLNNK